MQLQGRRQRGAAVLLVLLALVTAFSLVAVACGGGDDDDDDSSRRRSSQAQRQRQRERDREATRAARQTDSDNDGIVDADDQCPDERETYWNTEPDGCPDTLEDLLVFAWADIDEFWQFIFDESGVDYETAREFVLYGDEGGQSACGTLSPDNAFYCSRDHSVYFHRPFMQTVLDQRGDFAVAFVVAHEWGHLVQGNLGIIQTAEFTIDIELQADCFAGVWTRDAEERALLEEGDKDEAILTLFQVGDQFGTRWFDEGAHGSPGQRIDAFNTGYNAGVEICFERLHVPPPDERLED